MTPTRTLATRISLGLLASLQALSLWPAAAKADHLNFTIYNNSRYTVNRVYVSSSRSSSWNRNVLDAPLRSGGNAYIYFPEQSPNWPCYWDIKVVFRGGASSHLWGHNLCGSNNSVYIN